MRSHDFILTLLCTATIVIAQTLTLTIPNGGATVVQVFTTDAEGFPTRLNIATLSGNTTPTTTPTTGTSRTSSISSPTGSTSTKSPGGSTESSRPEKAKGTPAGAIAGILVAVVILVALALLLLFLKRRKRQRRRRLSTRVELDPIGSPVVDKQFIPDPFLTDTQARVMGYDLSRQPTRRIEAKFLTADQLDAADSSPPRPPIPRILLTREGETSGRPITPSSSGHHGDTHSLTGHTNHYPADVKSTRRLRSSPSEPTSSTDTLINGPSGSGASSQAEIAQRMRDLLVQLEHHVTAPSSDSGVAVTQLQRQVEMLQRENNELRSTGSEAPPAYDGDGRF